MASPSGPLLSARCCCYSHRFASLGNPQIGPFPVAAGSSSSPTHHPSPPPPSTLSDHHHRCASNFPGINNIKNQQDLRGLTMSTTTQGNIFSPRRFGNVKEEPDHLLVLVHGIVASPSDWTYIEAQLKRQLGRNFQIYVSSCNSYTKTFAGIDTAGKNLAAEVMQVVKKTESLKKISFLSHSLGGLFARYAIAILYSQSLSSTVNCDDLASCASTSFDTAPPSRQGTVAGLEPINFITLASPHLGVRGRKQLPFLFGVPLLEKLAVPLAPIVAGRTGNQLFLTDGKPNKPPLLLRMTSDCEDGKFMSALGAFRCRIVYANVSYDHIVGWRTSSIRRETELVQPPFRSLDGYKHIVNVEYCPPVSSEGAHFPPEATKAKEAAQMTPNIKNTVEYHEIMEEEMIRGLQQLGWKKVDVSFHSAPIPFLAHNNIHVKTEWLHSPGVGVVAHVVDCLKQQEQSGLIVASL